MLKLNGLSESEKEDPLFRGVFHGNVDVLLIRTLDGSVNFRVWMIEVFSLNY